ncbi:MAG: DUF5996 family protein [Candidatus Eremiobacteraeota bacterium]|nr:DUF5996 family protein [Candidatus Eremiobacteraeota bacterium]
MPLTLPSLPYEDWEPTKTTVHLFCQIVGKIRMASTAPRNHWWNVTLYVTAAGLSTGMMRVDDTEFEIEFDFQEHRLRIRTADGDGEDFKLRDGLSVAKFYEKLFGALRNLGINVEILAKPYGVPVKTPFAQDEAHKRYDRKWVERWWAVCRFTTEVFQSFASDFSGKVSPVHVFWHSLDLAMGLYNGKRAPQKPGANHVEAVAYSHEVIAIGFWAGDANIPMPAYYTYTAPEPAGLTGQPLCGEGAKWVPSGSGHMGLLPYDAVRVAAQPEAMLLDFVRSGYAAGTAAAGWDREALSAVL